jgi:hypothetical protein
MAAVSTAVDSAAAVSMVGTVSTAAVDSMVAAVSMAVAAFTVVAVAFTAAVVATEAAGTAN